ncbi:MAG: cytochrome c3 family protein [Clostridia bacterium]|nr:cytochrome c3 family protein [Clostridia bacterium]
MGRNNIIVFGVLLVLIIVFVSTTTDLTTMLGELVGSKPSPPTVATNTNPRDKATCGTCHSDKSNDFKKKYQHAPFVKWYCTDCHVPHQLGSSKYEFVVQVDKLCHSCHFDRKGEAKMSIQHPPYGKGFCTDCHDPHSSDTPKLLTLPQNKLCASCHKVSTKYDLPVKHPPYTKGYCSDCHTAHASNNRGLTILSGKKLCYSCHYDRLNELNMPTTHKPYIEGNCVDCHGPHATSTAKLLLLDSKKICFSCHKDKDDESKVGYQHKPFVTGECVDCHKPHAGRFDNLLLRDQSELCYMCHEKYRTIFTGPSYHPVGNGLLECYNCHDPHSGPGPKMTKGDGNKLCYNCHSGLEETYEKLAHATKAKGRGGLGKCVNCHVPHASKYKPLLFDQQIPMCGSCHGKVYKAPITHPVGEKYEDPWHGGSIQCTSCHGPHGTQFTYFTHLERNDLCIKCHGKKQNGKLKIHRKIK